MQLNHLLADDRAAIFLLESFQHGPIAVAIEMLGSGERHGLQHIRCRNFCYVISVLAWQPLRRVELVDDNGKYTHLWVHCQYHTQQECSNDGIKDELETLLSGQDERNMRQLC